MALAVVEVVVLVFVVVVVLVFEVAAVSMSVAAVSHSRNVKCLVYVLFFLLVYFSQYINKKNIRDTFFSCNATAR